MGKNGKDMKEALDKVMEGIDIMESDLNLLMKIM